MILETPRLRLRPLTDDDIEPFAGIILLEDVSFAAAFTPAIEVGWLLPRERWGKGYASEGGRAALDCAFTALKLREVVALTTVENIPHARGTALERCVLYRTQNPGY